MGVSIEPEREQVLKLIEEKTKIECKIADLGMVLHTNKVGFHDPLTDAEGFPRADIDVQSVRIARTQIICLQNDLKELTKSIEAGLEKYFQETKETLASTKIPPEVRTIAAEEAAASSNAASSNQTPIVVVNLVSPDSPAEAAGIQVRDLILSFGTISASNFKDLAQIGELVKNSQNQQVRVKVRREQKIEELILVPKVWSGRGFLGCNIVTYSSTQN